MITIPEELPIPKNHTMEIADSTKVQAYQDCPRGFFFSYVLGLRSDTPNVHLDFGSAWHDVMETLLLHGYGEKSQQLAFIKFMQVYREAFPDELTDQDRAPKNPAFTQEAIERYAKTYANDRYKTLYTETAGFVPISETRQMVVKLDSIVRNETTGLIHSLEHKTTGYNSSSWREKWQIMLQIEAYTHLLYSIFPPESVGGVIINGACFTKSRGFEGIRIPVHKSLEQMRAFLWNINYWIDQIERDYRELAKTTVNSPVMKAFPINCSSCSKFGCRMGGICSSFPNPLRFAEDPPPGYKVDYWDPLRNTVETSDNVITTKGDGSLEILPNEEKRTLKNEPSNDDFSMFHPK